MQHKMSDQAKEPTPQRDVAHVENEVAQQQPPQSSPIESTVEQSVSAVLGPAERVGANALSQLVRGLDNYMNDADNNFQQPLQMLQDLQLCGPGLEGMHRLTADGSLPHPLAQPALRHIRSSPLESRPSIFDQSHDEEEEEDFIPPPIPLDPFQRSSSTPQSFRQRSINSAFGSVELRSAFAIPSQRVPSSAAGSRYSAFDPVRYYANQLEDMERTSIEVMDMTPEKPATETSPKESEKSPTKRGAASRAARFLSDVRVLRRRRRRALSGRDNPAEPPSPSITDQSSSPPNSDQMDTSITVITEHETNPSNTSLLSQSSEVSAIVGGKLESEPEQPGEMYSPPVQEGEADEDVKMTDDSKSGQYQQLDSDVDEEEQHYQEIEAQLQPESPGTVPSPSYQQFVDGTSRDTTTAPKTSLRIKFPAMEKPRVSMSSPSPTRMQESDGNNQESPVTARSSITGSSSGHTTQATSTASSVGQSGLSTISETDREVMEANKEGKRRRSLATIPSARKNESDVTSVNSSSTTSSNSNAAYLALDNSSAPLRDGANVPVDRFFIAESSMTGNTGNSVVRSLSQTTHTTTSSSSRRSGRTSTSPSTSESATHTSSSGSSREEPPTFVSYLDRVADLVSVRESTEMSSPRADCEQEREGSPAEMGDLLFEEAKAPRGRKIICPTTKQRGRLEKFRTRPPRSPYKGIRSASTPPPRSSPMSFHQQLSPPRNIVDQPDSNLLSKPNVMRRAQPHSIPSDTATDNMLSEAGRSLSPKDYNQYEEEVILTEPEFSLDGETMKGRTYENGNVEVVTSEADKTTSVVPIVTPEKVGP